MATERLDEFELIDAITAGLPTSPAIVLGPGDDSAVFRVDGDAAISTDAIGMLWSLMISRRVLAASACDPAKRVMVLPLTSVLTL